MQEVFVWIIVWRQKKEKKSREVLCLKSFFSAMLFPGITKHRALGYILEKGIKIKGKIQKGPNANSYVSLLSLQNACVDNRPVLSRSPHTFSVRGASPSELVHGACLIKWLGLNV